MPRGGKRKARDEEDDDAKSPVASKKATGSKPLSGLALCISGNFTKSQAEMKAWIKKLGGTVESTPNKSCDYLIVEQYGSSKTQTAEKNGIKMMKEAWLREVESKGGIPNNE